MNDVTAIRPVLRVLAVDDEPDAREIFRLGLTSYGCRVETAANGHEALHILMRQGFDVLVVDLRMAGMNGVVFLEEALKVWPSVGVVIVSGHATPELLDDARKLGVTRVLTKPFDMAQLYSDIEAEASEKRRLHARNGRGRELELMKEHLKLLSDIEIQCAGPHSLSAILQDFGQDLARMMPADVVGILATDLDNGAHTLLLVPQRAVHERFLEHVRAEMLARFQLLNGTELAVEGLVHRQEGVAPDASGPAEVGSTLSVPVLVGREVCGLLTLASTAPSAYTTADASLLYHAANHVAAVFMALQHMHRLATRDPLTGLYNRIRMQEELERAWQSSRRYGPGMSVAVLDVDFFKTLNDSFGHDAGDAVIREFAGLVLQAARASDVVARFGGDEFIVILTHAGARDAYAFAERVLRQTRERVFCSDTHQLRLSISIGIASTDSPQAPDHSPGLLQQADRALYMAKRAGRNRICVWPGAGRQGELSMDVEKAGGAPAGDLQSRARVIVVDDEPTVLKIISAFLQKSKCEVISLTSAHEAVRMVAENPYQYDLLITDIVMPDMSGIDLLRELLDKDELIVKVVMSGHSSVDYAIQCLRHGAYDFISKPVEFEHLDAVVRRALEYRALRLENQRHQEQLERMVNLRNSQLTRAMETMEASFKSTLEAFMAMLDAREHQTGRHSLRVRELAVALGAHLGLTGEDLHTLATGALLHDIGKIGLLDKVLFHEGRLSAEDWALMKQHPVTGQRILQGSPHLHKAAAVVYEHHEHYDGTGYPRGLAGEQICLGARIFSVVDAYDAMRSNRTYREARSAEEAIAEIRAHRGTQFDPVVVDAFLECAPELESLYARLISAAPPEEARRG